MALPEARSAVFVIRVPTAHKLLEHEYAPAAGFEKLMSVLKSADPGQRDHTMSTRFYNADLIVGAWAWVAPVLSPARLASVPDKS
jgi:hypothetical protein